MSLPIGFHHSVGTRARMRRAATGRVIGQEQRRRQSETMRARWADPVWREQNIAAQTTPAAKAKIAEAKEARRVERARAKHERLSMVHKAKLAADPAYRDAMAAARAKGLATIQAHRAARMAEKA